MTGTKIQVKEDSDSPIHTDADAPNRCYKLHDEVAVSLQQRYILHMCGQRSKQAVALALSDYSVPVYDICNLKHIISFPAHTNVITDIKFSAKNEELLFSSSTDGTIKLHDLRCKSCVSEFKDDTDSPTELKPLTSFDVSCDENFASAGTELVDGDAFILFWDVRSSKLLGGYWESHTDDVTQVRYHPEKKNMLTTGSLDGLINVFDISKGCEDDALTYCLNTEASVDKLHWFRGRNKAFNLSCITRAEELQLWDKDDASPFIQFSRKDIAMIVEDVRVNQTYLVNTHNKADAGLLIIAGYSSKERTALQALSLDIYDMTILRTVSHLNANKQTVRCSWYDAEEEVLLTGGEGGFLSSWKVYDTESVDCVSSQLKHFKIKHKTKTKPYQPE